MANVTVHLFGEAADDLRYCKARFKEATGIDFTPDFVVRALVTQFAAMLREGATITVNMPGASPSKGKTATLKLVSDD